MVTAPYLSLKPSPLSSPSLTKIEIEAIKKRMNIPSLDTLSSAHLTGEQKNKFDAAVIGMRSWASAQREKRSFSSVLLMSAQTMSNERLPKVLTTGFGVGKTHMAKAAGYTAFGVVSWTGQTNTSIIVLEGKFFTSAEIVQEDALSRIGKSKVVIIDDVGRETTIKFVAAVDQTAERQRRYFSVIDHCYQRGIAMIITSNLPRNEFVEAVGGAAFSRLQEMVNPKNAYNLAGIPDYRPKIGGWDGW